MRLREIKYILSLTGVLKDSSLSFDWQTNKIGNLNDFKEFLNIVEILPFFHEHIELIKQTDIFSTSLNEIKVTESEYKKIHLSAMYLVQAADALSQVLSSILPEQKDNVISIKLPSSNDLPHIIKWLSDFEKSINQIITNKKIKGQLHINSWESGSFWVELVLGSQAAVSLVAGLAWSAAVISKKFKEGKLLEQHIKSLEIKNESMRDFLEKQKIATDLLIEQEVRHLQIEHFGSDEDNEQFERLKLAAKTFAELIQKGAEVHPALSAPEQVQNAFPNYKNIESHCCLIV